MEPGRRMEMVEEALSNESAIVCHSTLDKENQSVCRGFFNQHKTLPLTLAEAIGVLEFDGGVEGADSTNET